MTKQQITPLPETYFGTFMHGIAEYTGIASAYRTIEKFTENAVITSKYVAGTAVVSVGISTGAIQEALRGTAWVADNVVAPVNNVAQYVVKEGVKAAINLAYTSKNSTPPITIDNVIKQASPQEAAEILEEVAILGDINQTLPSIRNAVWEEITNLPTRASKAVNYLHNDAITDATNLAQKGIENTTNLAQKGIENATNLAQKGIELAKANPVTTAAIVAGAAAVATLAYLGHSYYQQYCLEAEKKELPDTLLKDIDKQFEILEKQYKALGLHNSAEMYESIVDYYKTNNKIKVTQIKTIQDILKLSLGGFEEDKIKQLNDCSVNLLSSLLLHQRFQAKELAKEADRPFVDRIKEERKKIQSNQKTL